MPRPIEMTAHGALRYIERVLGIDIGLFREAVKTEAEVWMAVSAWTGMTLDDVADILPDTVRRFGELTGTVKCNGHVYLIDEGRLVTVLPRGGTARRLHQRGR